MNAARHILVRRHAGFTLVEVLVALALLAMMSGLTFRGLETVLAPQVRLEEEMRKWRALGSAFSAVQQSLAVAVAHPGFVFSGESGTAGPASLAFVRTGFPGYEGALGDLQRATYRFNGGRIEQVFWPLDDKVAGAPQAMVLLEGVNAMGLRFLARDGRWLTHWPELNAFRSGLPAAVEMRLVLASGERLQRLFVLP